MKRPLKTLFSQLAGLSSIGFLLALASQMLLSYYFGTSADLDAYWLGLAVVQVVTFYIGPAREALVPELARRAPHDASAYFSGALNLLLLGLAASAIVMATMRGFIAPWLVDSRQPELLAKVATLLLVMAPLALLIPLTELFNNVLVAFDRVLVQGAVRVLSTSVLIVALLLAAGRAGIEAAVAGLLAGNVLALAVLWRVSSGVGLRFDAGVRPSADAVFFKVGGALLLAFGVSQLYVVFERNTFTTFGEGVVSAYQYGAALSQVPQMVLVGTLGTAMWPRALEAARNRDGAATSALVGESLALLMPFLGFITVFTHLHAEPLVYLLFFRGAFDERSLELTSLALSIYVLGLPFVAVSTILGRVLVSCQAARQLAITGLGSSAAGCAILVAARASGSLVIAFAHLPANVLAWSALGAWALRSAIGQGASRAVSASILRTFAMAAVPALAVYAVCGRGGFVARGHWEVALQLALDLVLCALVYGAAFFALRLAARVRGA